jgi:hypothetical protein
MLVTTVTSITDRKPSLLLVDAMQGSTGGTDPMRDF